jgi:hypothetical protein
MRIGTKCLHTLELSHVLFGACAPPEQSRKRRVTASSRKSQGLDDTFILQDALPGLLTPGRGWAGRVFEAGLRGLYQHMRNLGLEPGEEMLAAMQVGRGLGIPSALPLKQGDGTTCISKGPGPEPEKESLPAMCRQRQGQHHGLL